MNGQLADLTFTDPPYNVDYGNNAKDKMRGKDRRIMNDALGDGFYQFLFDACINLLVVTKAGKPSTPGANKRITGESLLMHVKAIPAEVKGKYGWPRMWKQLQACGKRFGKDRVRQRMRLHGIKARGKRKFFDATDSKYGLPIAPNLQERNRLEVSF